MVVEDDSLREKWHFRLNFFNLLMLFLTLLVLTLAGLSCLIWFTPLRYYLPGTTSGLREQLALQTYRVDSLQQQVMLQNTYMEMIRSAIAGDVQVDSVHSMDSLTLTEQQELLSYSFPSTDAFVAQYEAKAQDNMSLFDASTTQPVYTLFRPARGTIRESFAPADGHYGISIATLDNANVTSVLSGTVIHLNYVLYEGWTVMVQHDGDYVSVYRGVDKTFKQVGAGLQAGETLGLCSAERPLYFELWQHGTPVNPEQVIVF